jgi:hypothetical protein
MSSILMAVVLVVEGARAQIPAPHVGPATDLRSGGLRVSSNKRFLVHQDGTPFFYLADTAWELLHRATREDIELYLEKRRQQGFTVVHTMCLSLFGGLEIPNAHGHLPLLGRDPARPEIQTGPHNDYWDHVDFLVEAAAKRGMFVGLVATFGNMVGPVINSSSAKDVVFNASNAQVYGRFLGRRYRDRSNVVWILGGDWPATYQDQDFRPVWRAMAAGLREGDGGRHLVTYHPWRPDSSSRWFHAERWLDFNMLQSGHGAKDWHSYARIAGDYHLWPPKPTVDGEPRYEDHPVSANPALGYFDDYDARQAAYWAVFAGGFGHTYGSNDVWQLHGAGRGETVTNPRTVWTEALDQGGAWSMLVLRRLMLSRPFVSRVPDTSVVIAGQGVGAEHVEATRDQDGSYAFVYIPTGRTISVDLRKASYGPRIKAWWFNPRTGAASAIGEIEARTRREFHHEFNPPGEPTRGNDWVLVLDDAQKGYGPPGEPMAQR